MADAGSLLEAKNIVLNREGRLVLDRAGACFARGVVTALVGPSGAGKTSLLRCLNRLEQPEDGEVLLDGTDIRTILPTELRRRVGMIFQTPVLFEGGVEANLRYGIDCTDEDLANSLEGAGLDESFLERSSTALSVGQAQRVCIARALVRDPEVLLMDEPTSALDKNAAARIEDLIGELMDRDLTIVLVTHNLEQARRVASEGVLLMEGRVVTAGAISEIEAAWPDEGTA
jgi:putative ABC transport system ATP-binding protein